MQNLLRKAQQHAFVASVSVAAFTHSSWSLATVFSGHEPSFGLAWLGWIIPGALIAGSVDIGLLHLAARIQHRQERTLGRVTAFAVLCAGMFALQGLYVASHMPVIELGPGVRADWIPAVSLFRDSMLIVVPGLLPLALILHTISGAEAEYRDARSDDAPAAGSDGVEMPGSSTPAKNFQEVVTEPARPLALPGNGTSPSGNGHKPSGSER